MGMRKILINRFGKPEPVFTVIDDHGESHPAGSIILVGPCELKCEREADGALRIWVETFDKVIVKSSNSGDGFPSLTGL